MELHLLPVLHRGLGSDERSQQGLSSTLPAPDRRVVRFSHYWTVMLKEAAEALSPGHQLGLLRRQKGNGKGELGGGKGGEKKRRVAISEGSGIVSSFC